MWSIIDHIPPRVTRIGRVQRRARRVGATLGFGGLALLVAVVATRATQAASGDITVPSIPQIFLVASGGGAPRQLTSGKVAHSNATWLLRGRRIAELASRGPLTWIQSQNTQGGSTQRLSGVVSTPNTAPAMTYSPSARMTAAATFDENELSDTLRLLASPNARPTVVDSFPDTGNGPSTPVWSPDGTTLAYTRPSGPLRLPTVGVVTEGTNQIALYSLRTHRRRILASGDRNSTEPVFSPNGRWMLYARGSGSYPALEIARARGGTAREIATNVATYGVAWSPSGQDVAFSGYTRGNPQPYLFILNVHTRSLVRLATSVQLITPAWSPDGKEIAFATWFTALEPAPPQGYGAVVVIRPNGTDQRVLATAPGSRTDDLAWNPTGSEIAFTLQPAPKGD